MSKLKFERHNPDPEYILRKALLSGARKIKQKISEQGFKITPDVLDRLTNFQSELKEKHHLNIEKKKILEKALEMINQEQGGLPEKIRSSYETLIAEKIADSVNQGEDFYQALRERMVELKRKGISLDSQQIEKQTRKLLG